MTRPAAGPRQLPKPDSRRTTAGRMADAVSFLIRVADEASMHGIARNLSTVRVRLLQIAQRAGGTEDATS